MCDYQNKIIDCLMDIVMRCGNGSASEAEYAILPQILSVIFNRYPAFEKIAVPYHVASEELEPFYFDTSGKKVINN